MNKSGNIMILGGNGFIGQNLTQYFHANGYTVSVFDLKAPDNPVEGVNYLEGDFFEDANLDRITEGQDTIIHALTTINPSNSNASYMRGYSKDFVQTMKLFDRLTETKGKLLFFSSAGTIYGRYEEGRPFVENDRLRPINHYGSIKLCIETAMRAFNVQQHTHLMACRIANPYGPGQDYRKGVGFIDAVVKAVMNDTTVEIWGDGSIIRDYIYIEDLCRMLEGLVHYDGDLQTFNISTGVGTSQNEIIELFRRLGFNVKVKYLDARTVDAKCNIVSNEKIVGVTGVQCRSLEEGIKAYLRYLNMI
ncbi:MAG: NAD-dependent epimerase/dehydratase family protein [Lachnospiraceae bacterium]|nr:NAD-dependent epimerase/dehydratase family protein [Lachnospiraceae bacterium]